MAHLSGQKWMSLLLIPSSNLTALTWIGRHQGLLVLILNYTYIIYLMAKYVKNKLDVNITFFSFIQQSKGIFFCRCSATFNARITVKARHNASQSTETTFEGPCRPRPSSFALIQEILIPSWPRFINEWPQTQTVSLILIVY